LVREGSAATGLKIAYFAGTMRPGHDGVTRVLYKLVDYLAEKRIENIFFSPIVPEDDMQQTKMHAVPSIAFPLYKDYRISISVKKSIAETLQGFKPDILHINSPCSLGYAAIRYGQEHDIPVVATYHTHFASYAKYYKVKALETLSWNYFRKVYNSCARTFVPSEPIRNELAAHGIKNLEYLPHGVDMASFDPQYASSQWKADHGIQGKHALLFVGRLVWEKDLATLAETYRILSAQRDDIAFVLIGDGPIRQDLEKLMPEAKFLGYQQGKDLARAYASSDVFVFPSTTETFGNVTLEAMASGVPPICAREGGAYGIIQQGKTGLIAQPRDPADLAEKIELLLDNPPLREDIAQRAYDFARTQSWDKIFDRLMNAYGETLLENKHNHRQRQMEAA